MKKFDYYPGGHGIFKENPNSVIHSAIKAFRNNEPYMAFEYLLAYQMNCSAIECVESAVKMANEFFTNGD